jgi:hypothetical protein
MRDCTPFAWMASVIMSRNTLPSSVLTSVTLATKCSPVTVGFEKPHTYKAVANWTGGLNQHALDGTRKIN